MFSKNRKRRKRDDVEVLHDIDMPSFDVFKPFLILAIHSWLPVNSQFLVFSIYISLFIFYHRHRNLSIKIHSLTLSSLKSILYMLGVFLDSSITPFIGLSLCILIVFECLVYFINQSIIVLVQSLILLNYLVQMCILVNRFQL